MKSLVIILAVIILVLISVFFFVPAPPAAAPSNPASSTAPVYSSDGHLAVSLPRPDGAITSPVLVAGEVTGGGWFFEATFPVKVLDSTGAVIGRGQARAGADWTSSGTVPFSASITFTAPHTPTGTIVFENDNPSGLPQNQKRLELPVQFR